MAEIGIAVAGKAAELSVVAIGKHICYPFKCQSNIDCLKKQVEKLEDLRGRVKHEVDEAERQGDGIENDVSKWLNSVDEFIQGVKKTIIEDEENAKKRCFIGLCPNLMMRYSLSKKAANKTKDGVVLFGEGKFKNVSYRQPLQKIPSSYSRGYDDFDSRKENFNDLMEALRKADVNLIGVYGMGGVGKTTLVKKVAAQALEEQLFDMVVMVEVTETTPDIKNIQGQIADKLGLKFPEETLQGRAGRLCERLKKEKKVLIVLDNIWKKLDLDAVGIPSREEEDKRSSLQVDRKGRNDEQRQSLQADPKGKNDELWRCKVLLTSRKLHVLRDMNIRKNVQLR
ncbi:hypothetical protein LWI29_013521 [Acer saccharum]|uniref:AAA+ ATPase domain-containing protein n=1 Tax=Acer saccharum TaxID=4024 RepID=A0AA39RYK1_ACESA|nr:hypothetical protein LWI29_013521 [Acer saccharum]